ncbi:uncharacterized protein LOC120677940 [Panicum virgatum]|uniref:uncharacterized protein LOC120677940 n=1 Tax=Panicum virgatum TaxID=38727 RepID=UPI0019D574F0|nr:uncharacterized protein LOC120677940 [Panicum virgatum]
MTKSTLSWPAKSSGYKCSRRSSQTLNRFIPNPHPLSVFSLSQTPVFLPKPRRPPPPARASGAGRAGPPCTGRCAVAVLRPHRAGPPCSGCRAAARRVADRATPSRCTPSDLRPQILLVFPWLILTCHVPSASLATPNPHSRLEFFSDVTAKHCICFASDQMERQGWKSWIKGPKDTLGGQEPNSDDDIVEFFLVQFMKQVYLVNIGIHLAGSCPQFLVLY